METQTEILKSLVEVDGAEIFVLVLLPQLPAFGVEKPLEIEICGRSMIKWIDEVVAGYEHKKVDVKKSDDIMTIVRENASEHKYTVVVYADTPLLTKASIEQAVAFAASFEHKVCKMPRGWVFTDIKSADENLEAVEIPNLIPEDFIVAYNYPQLALIATHARMRINTKHLRHGVNLVDPHNAYIDADVVIGKGTRVGPGVVIRGESKIGKNCRLTNFVEIKNSNIGDGVKIAHMSYIGDAEVGDGCNIGCGVVFCNYNGKVKEKITLGSGVFVGSNSNLVAPLTVGENAYIAAGSTITQEVPKNALGIARARQAIKEDWNSVND